MPTTNSIIIRESAPMMITLIKVMKHLIDKSRNTNTGICIRSERIKNVLKSPGCKNAKKKKIVMFRSHIILSTYYLPGILSYPYSPYISDNTRLSH